MDLEEFYELSLERILNQVNDKGYVKTVKCYINFFKQLINNLNNELSSLEFINVNLELYYANIIRTYIKILKKILKDVKRNIFDKTRTIALLECALISCNCYLEDKMKFENTKILISNGQFVDYENYEILHELTRYLNKKLKVI